MPIYVYKARGSSGIVTDRMDAESERAVALKLRSQQMFLISAELEKKGSNIHFPLSFKKKPKASVKELSIFSRQFATMINAGIPILQSLTIIADQIESKGLKEVVKKIKDDIGSGSTLSDGMAKYPNIFSTLYVNMIKAGETGGILDGVMLRLSTYLEQADSLKRKVKSALVYPIVVSSIATIVVIFLLVAVIPTFKDIFASFGATLPAPTRILLGISDTLQKIFLPPLVFIILPSVIAAVIVFLRLLKTNKGRKKWNALQLKLPIFGMLFRKVAVSKFTRTFGTLIKSGVPILQALDIVAKTSGNMVVEEAILKAKNSIKEGESITAPIKACGIFPPMVVQMISVGEETGTLDEMLVKSADFYDDEVETAIAGLTSMIEPLLMAFMGVTIGAIVIAMFMPMFELGTIVK